MLGTGGHRQVWGGPLVPPDLPAESGGCHQISRAPPLLGPRRPPTPPHTQTALITHTEKGWGLEDLTYINHSTSAPSHHLSGAPMTSIHWLAALVAGMGCGTGALASLWVVSKNTDTWDPKPALMNQTFWGGVQKTGLLKTSPRV